MPRDWPKPRAYLKEVALTPEPDLEGLIVRALATRRKREPELTQAQWIRQACRAQALRDLRP